MKGIEPVIEALQETLLRKLGDEVELIFQYGSHLHGAIHKYSDVDISYVPAQEATWTSITVMVEETLFDLYPIHWSQLERMAEFRDISSSVLLHNRILYQRDAATAARFQALAARLCALQQPEARPEMLRRAMELFQSTGYDYYLLRLQAEAGHQAGCLKQAQSILRTVLHCLAVCNQACIDTRKMAQVLSLPKLPPDFAEIAGRVAEALEPAELFSATETLLQATRNLLLAEQQGLRETTSFTTAFDSSYPELKRDLQGVMLACERQDLLAAKSSLLSLLPEVSLALAQVSPGIAYSGFNSLADYEQDLGTLGFPALMPYLAARDFTGLQRQCLVFDRRLQEFLIERSVRLNVFATPADLREYLEADLV